LVSKKTPNVAESIVFSDHSSLGPASTYEWNFGLDATPATATGIGPHAVTYSTLGLKTVELVVTGSGGSDTKTKVDFVNVSVPSSTVDLASVGISVFPNPTKGLFYVESTSLLLESAEVYNALSNKVMEASSFNNERFSIDLSNQPQGMYLLILRTNGGTYTKKMLKTN
jgi:PKD repeat protein